jgi:hypothetical protein
MTLAKAKPKNRKRPHVLRVSPEIKGLVQAYAAEHGIPATEAAELLIRGAPDDVARLSAEKEFLTKERDFALAEREWIAAERDSAALALDIEVGRKDRATGRVYTLTERINFVLAGLREETSRADNAEDDVSKILAHRRALVRIMRLWDGWDPEDDDHAKSVLESISVALVEAGLAANGTLSESGGRLAERVEAEDEKEAP